MVLFVRRYIPKSTAPSTSNGTRNGVGHSPVYRTHQPPSLTRPSQPPPVGQSSKVKNTSALTTPDPPVHTRPSRPQRPPPPTKRPPPSPAHTRNISPGILYIEDRTSHFLLFAVVQ